MRTTAACTADWVTIIVRAPSQVVKDMATAMTRMICHTPVPKKCRKMSPISTPTVTPIAISVARHSRCPKLKPRHTMVATTARKGALWDSRVVASHHDTPAAREIWTIMNSRDHQRLTLRFWERHPHRAVRSLRSKARREAF